MKNKLLSCYYGLQISKNKTFEYQHEIFDEHSSNPFHFDIKWSAKTDHAGFGLHLSVYKLFWIDISICDNRHWDYDNNCWKKYDSTNVD